jgi:hypothetical protein
MAILYNIRPVGIFLGCLVYFPRFGMLEDNMRPYVDVNVILMQSYVQQRIRHRATKKSSIVLTGLKARANPSTSAFTTLAF